MKWELIGALIALASFALATVAQPDTTEVYRLATGYATQNDQEADECYLNVGHGPDALMISAHPKSMVCHRFRELAQGKRYGRLVFIPEETQ